MLVFEIELSRQVQRPKIRWRKCIWVCNFETAALTVLKIGEGVGIAYKWQV